MVCRPRFDPGWVAVFGRPKSNAQNAGTPLGVRLRFGSQSGGIAALNPRLMACTPFGVAAHHAREQEHAKIYITETLKTEVFAPSPSPEGKGEHATAQRLGQGNPFQSTSSRRWK